MSSKNKSEKKQHIQVFTRVRPLSSQELRSQVVVECVSSKEVSVRDRCQTKTFTFDKVFGPESKQVDVYKVVVSPLISEVLQGYNCTVFAYGQTGTGKTFTMVGEKSDSHNGNWEDDPSCGIIPRTLNHLFDELKVRADEFTVRVSFLELYNEELFDLLAPNDNDDGKNLKLFEDSMKKGSVIVSGLEERTVHNKNDVYTILEAGNLRRQTAPTLMNAQSSRSHTIFTITVHIKVTTPEGEDLIKTGKLNLVDLAGSENIGRSGAVEMRAREAGSINQSLLTLGRVITSLVERTPHVPYRESKLTRILQDSLGGKTKTSIIATVSPALCNIEETLSTFDYAHRARNITNKPEINQKTSKSVLLKEYSEEIERLRRDLLATREKHGVYLASENYNAIMAERENLNKELVSKLQLLKVREDELLKQEEIMKCLNMNLYATQSELAVTSEKLQEATKLCIEREDMLCELKKQANALLKTADEAVNDAKTLHDRLARSRRILEHNFNSSEKFKNNFCHRLDMMKTRTKEFASKGISEVETQVEEDKKLVSCLEENQIEVKEFTDKVLKETNEQIKSTIERIADQTTSNRDFLSEHLETLKSAIDTQNYKAHDIISNLTDYSHKIQSDWKSMFENFERNIKIVEEQRSHVELLRGKLTELTKMALALPMIYNEKLKERENTLELYAEKCEFLEKKRFDMRKEIEDFGHVLYKMAQNHMELLQRKSQCEEALKNVQNDKKYEEDNLWSEILEILRKNASDINSGSEETQKISEMISKSTAEVINNSTEAIHPLMNQIIASEEKWTNGVKFSLRENSTAMDNQIAEIEQHCQIESKKIIGFSEDAINKSSLTVKAINDFGTWMNDNANHLKITTENILKDNLAQKQLISSQIADYSNEIFSNIHDRVKEVEKFFSEGIKRDEKTGNTPQRKEFIYPRNILCYSNNNTNFVRQESQQNSVNDINDWTDNKENIGNQ